MKTLASLAGTLALAMLPIGVAAGDEPVIAGDSANVTLLKGLAQQAASRSPEELEPTSTTFGHVTLMHPSYYRVAQEENDETGSKRVNIAGDGAEISLMRLPVKREPDVVRDSLQEVADVASTALPTDVLVEEAKLVLNGYQLEGWGIDVDEKLAEGRLRIRIVGLWLGRSFDGSGYCLMFQQFPSKSIREAEYSWSLIGESLLLTTDAKPASVPTEDRQ